MMFRIKVKWSFHSISVSLPIQFEASIKCNSDCKLFFTPAHTKINGQVLNLPLWVWRWFKKKYSWTNIAFVFVIVSVVFAAGDLPWTSCDLLICHSEASCTVCSWSLCVSWGWAGQQGLICSASELKRSTSFCEPLFFLGNNPGRGECKVLAKCKGWRDHSVSLCLLFPFMKVDTSLQGHTKPCSGSGVGRCVLGGGGGLLRQQPFLTNIKTW